MKDSLTSLFSGLAMALLIGIAVGVGISYFLPSEDQGTRPGMCDDTITEVYSLAAEDQDREGALNRVFESDMECRTK